MSVTSIVTPASSYALTTVERVAQELSNTPSSSQEESITSMIDEASQLLVSELDRALVKERVMERLPATGSRWLLLSRYPLIEVHSIKFGEGGDPLDPSDYDIITPSISELYKKSGWRSTQLQHLGADTHPADAYAPNWFVEYTAGFVTRKLATSVADITLPFDIERAVVDTVRSWFARSGEDPNLSSQKVGRASRSFGVAAGGSGPLSVYPPSMRRVIHKYSETVIL